MQPSEMAERIRAVDPEKVTIDLGMLAEEPWPYQRQDVAVMLAQKDLLIGNEVGTGKSVLGIAAAAYLKAHGDFRGMVVFMPKMAGVLPTQWEEEVAKWAPHLTVAHGRGRDRHHRLAAYQSEWDILLLNYEAARNDIDYLDRLFGATKPSILFADEAQQFRNGGSKTARLMRKISPHFEYRYAVTGTPIQTNLDDLHGICSSMGWKPLVQTKAWFYRNFVIRQQVEYFAKGGVARKKWVVVGYKNVGALRRRLAPWFVRRTLAEPEVAKHLPEVVPFVFKIPLRKEQLQLYRAAREGILFEVDESGLKPSYMDTRAKFGKLIGVADGTRTYDAEMDDHSAKSDWLLSQLTHGPLAGEKVLVFSRFVRSVWPLRDRLEAAGIGHALFLGTGHQSDAERTAEVERFKKDVDCRVLIGTAALEMGLNLQVARVLVFYSGLGNPQRMHQILGRIRRAGSPYGTVAAITLLSEDTVEEGLYESALERNAVADVFWEEESVLFEQLGVEHLMQLIRGYEP